MDLLVRGLLKNYVASEELGYLSDADAFEVFASWLAFPVGVVSQVRASDLLLDPGTPGIDAILMDINGEVVWDAHDVDEACSSGANIEVSLHFLQAKYSEKVDSSQMLNFGAEVVDVLSGNVSGYPKRDAMALALAHLYDAYSSQIRDKPNVRLFFATGASSRTLEQDFPKARFGKILENVRELTHVGEVEGQLIGAADLHELWTRRKNGNSGSLQFVRSVNLPAMPGVDQAMLGIASVRDLLNLLETSSGQLDESLFYDNVRGFQGAYNSVNRQIVATLASEDRSLLPVMNNGVTIVAESYTQKPGDAVGLSGYQVVNGCQTTHCLYVAKETLGEALDETYVPVRVVVTRDSDVATSIIMATNSQTPVRDGELESLTKFQKRLEEFYLSDPLGVGLRYERRPGQFYGQEVTWTRVVSVRDQMRFVGAMFLNRAHESAGYVGQLRERIGDQLFADDHDLAPYAASAFAAYKLENAFRYDFDTRFKPIRYHILMMCKYLVLDAESVSLDSKRSGGQARQIVEALKSGDPTRLFRDAASFILGASGGRVPSPETVKRYSFTQELQARWRERSALS